MFSSLSLSFYGMAKQRENLEVIREGKSEAVLQPRSACSLQGSVILNHLF